MSGEWQRAVEDELVCIGILNESHKDPRKALQAIIQWNVDVALDPSVSEEARKLQLCYVIMKQYGRGILRRSEEVHGLFHGRRAQANAHVRKLNKKASMYHYFIGPTQNIYPEKK